MNEYDFELPLSSPMTQEDWDKLTDVDMENTSSVVFNTKGGKDVEFVKILRCKDCKHQFEDSNGHVIVNACELNRNYAQPDDWFCADGERRPG